jgi:hypothetical protein
MEANRRSETQSILVKVVIVYVENYTRIDRKIDKDRISLPINYLELIQF